MEMTDENGESMSKFYEGTLKQLAPEATEGEGTEAGTDDQSSHPQSQLLPIEVQPFFAVHKLLL
jgi:hypothetical protein